MRSSFPRTISSHVTRPIKISPTKRRSAPNEKNTPFPIGRSSTPSNRSREKPWIFAESRNTSSGERPPNVFSLYDFFFQKSISHKTERITKAEKENEQ